MIKVSSILIGVSDLEKSKLFYEKVLGLTFTEFRPPFASATLEGVEFNIEEDADYREKGWADKNRGGRKNVSFEVPSLDDFLKEVSRLEVKIVQEVEEKPWKWKEAIVADRDGNEFVIEQEM